MTEIALHKCDSRRDILSDVQQEIFAYFPFRHFDLSSVSRPLRKLGLCSFFGAPLFIGLDALYTYLFSVSIVFCKSSQYINRNKSNCREGKLRRAASRFCKPRSFIARAACFLGRGRPYQYTQSVYKYTTLRVNRSLASQAF